MNIFKSYNHIQHGETPPRERQKAQHIRTGIRRKRQSHPLYGNPPLRKEAGTCSCSRSHFPLKGAELKWHELKYSKPLYLNIYGCGCFVGRENSHISVRTHLMWKDHSHIPRPPGSELRT